MGSIYIFSELYAVHQIKQLIQMYDILAELQVQGVKSLHTYNLKKMKQQIKHQNKQ